MIVWTSPTSPSYCCYTTLRKSEHQKCMWTQLQLLMLTTKESLHASNMLTVSSNVLMNHMNHENQKFSSEHVFKVSTTSAHTWSQTVTSLVAVASIMSRWKSDQVCIKHFHRSLTSWIVSYLHCCITPEISKFKAHDGRGPLWWNIVHFIYSTFCWLCGPAVEHRSLAGLLSLSCAWPVADGWPLMWVNHPL